MSDLSDDDTGEDTMAHGSAWSSSRPGGGKKRANHNELERKRRQHQKDQLNSLRDAIPSLRQDKPSTVLILAKAKEYIDLLSARVLGNEKEVNKLLEQTGGRTRSPDRVVQLASQSLSAGVAIKHEDYDSLHQENAELKARWEQLQAVESPVRSIPTPGKKEPSTPSAHAARPSPPMSLPGASPVHGQTVTFNESSPATSKLASLAQVVTLEVETGGGLASGLTVSANDGLSLPSLYRKRKSYADNDFEEAKRAYHSSRRNSSFDILQQIQEDQQRLHITEDGLNDASLLQNFVRRASLPSAFFDGPPPMLAQHTPPMDNDDDGDNDNLSGSDRDDRRS